MKSLTSLSTAKAQWLKWLWCDRLANRPATQQGLSAGFTLLELLVVMVMVGILAALAGPSWVNFANSQRLGTAQDATLRAFREGQAAARQKKTVWEVCFRDTGTNVEYSVHRSGNGGCENAIWEPLLGETNALVQISNGNTSLVGGGPYRVQFNNRGWVATGQDGAGSAGNDVNVSERISFAIRDQENLDLHSCVFIDTLLGAVRVERNDVCKGGGG
ncbi:MAG: type II secretion system protein [Cyanobacteria bacterium P01_D01_bin.73]